MDLPKIVTNRSCETGARRHLPQRFSATNGHTSSASILVTPAIGYSLVRTPLLTLEYERHAAESRSSSIPCIRLAGSFQSVPTTCSWTYFGRMVGMIDKSINDDNP